MTAGQRGAHRIGGDQTVGSGPTVPAAANTAPLTPAEIDQLAADEAIIDAGQIVFMKVGMALARIRDQRLYRATHDTFAEYVDQRWGFKRTRAYQLIEAGEVAASMSTMVDIPIENERQARAVAKVLHQHGADVAASVLYEVALSGKVTADAITETAKQYDPLPITPPTAEQITESEALVSDADDIVLPDHPDAGRPVDDDLESDSPTPAPAPSLPTPEQIQQMPLREVMSLAASINDYCSTLTERARDTYLDAHETAIEAAQDRVFRVSDFIGAVELLTAETGDLAEAVRLGLAPSPDEMRQASAHLARLADLAEQVDAEAAS